MHLKGVQNLAGKVTVRSSVNPLLWAGLVIALPLFYLADKTDSNGMRIAFFIIASLIVLSILFAYFYFMFIKPDYLRSEEYQLKKQALEIYGDQGKELTEQQIIDATSIKNPTLLSEGEKE